MQLKDMVIRNHISIVDMGLIWLLATPTASDREKIDGTPYTWKDYADKVFDVLMSRHPEAILIIAVNDYYGSDVVNVKDGEHMKRSKAFLGGRTKNVYPANDRILPNKKEFEEFFCNPLNKVRLQAFLKDSFSLRCEGLGRKILYVEKYKCTDIPDSPAHQLVQKLRCSHLEADTAMLFVYAKIRDDYTSSY